MGPPPRNLSPNHAPFPPDRPRNRNRNRKVPRVNWDYKAVLHGHCKNVQIAKMRYREKFAIVENGALPVGQGQGQAWLDHFGGKVDFPRTFRKFSSDFFGLKSGHADVFRGKNVLHVRTTAFFSGKTGMVTAGGASRGSESRGSTALRHERPRASF